MSIADGVRAKDIGKLVEYIVDVSVRYQAHAQPSVVECFPCRADHVAVVNTSELLDVAFAAMHEASLPQTTHDGEQALLHTVRHVALSSWALGWLAFHDGVLFGTGSNEANQFSTHSTLNRRMTHLQGS